MGRALGSERSGSVLVPTLNSEVLVEGVPVGPSRARPSRRRRRFRRRGLLRSALAAYALNLVEQSADHLQS